MTLGSLEKHLKEMREQGATDDSEVYILEHCDFCHIQDIEYDNVDNSINIYPE